MKATKVKDFLTYWNEFIFFNTINRRLSRPKLLPLSKLYSLALTTHAFSPHVCRCESAIVAVFIANSTHRPPLTRSSLFRGSVHPLACGKMAVKNGLAMIDACNAPSLQAPDILRSASFTPCSYRRLLRIAWIMKKAQLLFCPVRLTGRHKNLGFRRTASRCGSVGGLSRLVELKWKLSSRLQPSMGSRECFSGECKATCF